MLVPERRPDRTAGTPLVVLLLGASAWTGPGTVLRRANTWPAWSPRAYNPTKVVYRRWTPSATGTFVILTRPRTYHQVANLVPGLAARELPGEVTIDDLEVGRGSGVPGPDVATGSAVLESPRKGVLWHTIQWWRRWSSGPSSPGTALRPGRPARQRAAAAPDADRADWRPSCASSILFHDVGGTSAATACGAAVGAPNAQHRPVGPARARPYASVLTRSLLHAVTGVADDRSASHAPLGRLVPPCTASWAAWTVRVTLAQLLSAAGYTTQAVEADIGENVEFQPQHVGFDDRRIPVGVGHVHRVAGPGLLPGDRLQRGTDPVGGEPPVQQVLGTPRGRGRPNRWRR